MRTTILNSIVSELYNHHSLDFIMNRPLSMLFKVGDMPTSRIEAFSDGIFAVILTLLVLEIHVPELHGTNLGPALVHSLILMAPKFMAYMLSFVIICIWWVAHHHFFHV